MAKVLYITANPKADEQSYSLSVGRAFLDAYRTAKPNDEIIELDLYQVDIPYIDTDVFNGWGKLQQGTAFEQLSAEEKAKVAKINEFTEQFISVDKYVFVTPLWNFSIPPKMKAYIDTICIAGKTFRYTENGPVGLLSDKKAVHIQARGGVYSEGPAKDVEFGDRYMRAIFGFIGITDAESIIVEGMAQMPNEAGAIKERAIAHAKEVASRFAAETVRV
ncbi:FMN-dependent NADH-azoreductase [Ammoniphilus sp. CFH 90114]|uniref:FMN-dependent NADH-azoreductase n=1 Tax=Ammoniphilus sp. CFH 90114 TaxID=2493665 RepID=UPI00100EDBD5|nr:FMN-dependent NADH-azoreductase [Ammoniphilus sp. CFH 90114]RXT07965.1 FMN-dependent NADH-azoreductase [Ammoniphilus sp. CFH 90114]